MTPDEIRTHATEIILDHARDIEPLSISEYLEELDLPAAEHNSAREAIDDAITAATVTVEWPQESTDE